MSEHPIRAQVADVVAQGPTGKPWRGSGYLVADGWVLTAQHVVDGATKVAVWLGAPTRLERDGQRDVELKAALLDERSDLALLPITKGAVHTVEPALFGRLDRDSAAPVPAVAAGCPRFKLRVDPASGKSTVRELHVAHGTITPPSNAKTDTYELAVTFQPPEDPQGEHSPWESMSGAAAWADQRIIGVVAQHHPGEGTGVLTVKPLETLLGVLSGEIDRWCVALSPRLPKRPGDLWMLRRAATGEADVQRARAIAAQYSPEQLLERDKELASLDLLLTSDAQWCWIKGETYAGKTALLAWVATHPPPGITVVSCFLRSTTGENTASYALSALNGQLAAVANRVDHQEALYFSEQKIQLHTLLPDAARACYERGCRLVVIIDGLDEYAPSGIPLKKWLIGEAKLLPNAMLLAASRTGVEVDLPVGHPLREHVRILSPTQMTVELRELAEEELRQALAAKNRLEYAIAGFIAAAIGGLALSELIELLHRTDPAVLDIAVTDTLATSFHRTLIPTPNPTGRPVYVFAHAALEQTAQEWLAKDLTKFEVTLLSWCDDYRDRNFPEETPHYVLSHYPEHLYAAARTSHLPTQAADATAEALRDIYSTMPYVERVVVTLGIDHLMRAMQSLMSREELPPGVIDTLKSLLRLFALEAHHLRDPYPVGTSGYVVRQLALQALAENNHHVLHRAQEHLGRLNGGQLVPQWSTSHANPLLISVLAGHTSGVSAVAVTNDGTQAVTGSRDTTARVWDLSTGQLIHTLTGHINGVSAVSVTDDGTRVVTGSWDATARVWDLSTGQLIHILAGHTNAVMTITLDGNRAVTGSWDATARVWDLSTGQLIHTLTGHSSGIWAASITADESKAVTVSQDTTARVWDLDTGQLVHTLTGHTSAVMAVATIPDGARAVTVSSDGTGRVWDLSTGGLIHPLIGHDYGVLTAAVTADGAHVVTAGLDRTARVWDLTTGQLVHTLTGHANGVETVAITPDGTRIVTGSMDGTARMWDLTTGQLVHQLTGHTGAVLKVAVTPEGSRAITASTDETARVWNLASEQVDPGLSGHASEVTAVAVTTDGSRAISTSLDGTGRVWDLATGQLLHILTGHTNGVNAVAISPQGGHAVTVSLDGTGRVWDLATGQLIHTLTGHAHGIEAVAITPEGTRAVTVSLDGTGRVWDLATGQLVHVLKGHSNAVWRVAVTADGFRAVTVSQDTTARVWDLATGQLIHTLAGHNYGVEAVAVTPDAARTVTVSSDGTGRVWDLATGQLIHTLAGNNYGVGLVLITANGTRAVIAGSESTVRVWDLIAGKHVQQLTGHTGSVISVAVTPEGFRAVTTSWDKTLRIWDIATGSQQQVVTAGYNIRGLAVSQHNSTLGITAGDASGALVHFAISVKIITQNPCETNSETA